ncbi:MAG: prepilin-type N-terminal cleavage/methylation domain-containing protein [Candidatus Manganitrophus sp.]|nr:prepilin-type N-terminal cleavage/methylation domain-containing protein [Candidatus Manganitrophus sp.]
MAKPSGEAGFTLVEVVLIIVLLMILAAGVLPRAGNMAGTKAAAAARKLQSDIAYAQQLAMVRNLRHRVYFNAAPAPASGYAVVNNADGDATWGEAGEVAVDPVSNAANLSVTLNTGDYAGITISAVGFTGSYIEFNSLGASFDGGGALAVAKSVTVSGGGIARTVTVQPSTGRVSSP